MAHELAAPPFVGMMLASRSDPWMDAARAESWALRWGADFVDLGDAGHVNVDSGHGPWPFGFARVRALAFGAADKATVLPVHASRRPPTAPRNAVSSRRYVLDGPAWVV